MSFGDQLFGCQITGLDVIETKEGHLQFFIIGINHDEGNILFLKGQVVCDIGIVQIAFRRFNNQTLYTEGQHHFQRFLFLGNIIVGTG
ncbi:hypothetical protein D3C73_979360 [compost metagenome]